MTENISTNPLTDVPFSDLDLNPAIISGLEEAKFTHCTPIQALTLPPALEGDDVAGQAQTGTGKTAAFLLVIFNQLLKQKFDGYGNNPRSLIVAPTRELASQISEEFSTYGRNLNLRMLTVYGGVSQRPQTDALSKGVDIMVATPGRLLDLIQQRFISLSDIEFFR